MKNSIDVNKEYKNQKKIEKEREKMKILIEKKRMQQQKAIEKKIEKLKEKSMKKLELYAKKKQILFEKKVRKIQGKKPLKKHENKISISKLKREYITLLQKYARLRDSNKQGIGLCISCGKPVHWKDADGGHYISRMYSGTAYDLRNINLQCKYCNGQLHGNQAEYRKRLIDKIGIEEVEDLESRKFTKKEFTVDELKYNIKWIEGFIRLKEIEKLEK